MSAERLESSRCRMCSNRCMVSFLVDEVGIVALARRGDATKCSASSCCSNLAQVEGKSLDRALRFINMPTLPRLVSNGH
ncbi:MULTISPECIES: hypothetical protein [Gordonibacter]|uniref:4Fe-4S Mo/W bis-MGD-type domain-containing protein n=1 Tax=Gordonibacter faecis TaxID=3047475 RepID=A0ABT7DK52_9ACTN|nr:MULTISPECIES: hypothetical protein [unclassified Gordonibacter]MDJ1649896.1 hypothetical protein [Gordonibacter sp. KGMB12511]